MAPKECQGCGELIAQDEKGFWFLTNPAFTAPWKCPANLLGHTPKREQGER